MQKIKQHTIQHAPASIVDELLEHSEAQESSPLLVRGTIREISDDGSIQVQAGTVDAQVIRCDMLLPYGAAVSPEVGDRVLIMLPQKHGESGIVLGRIGKASTGSKSAKEQADHVTIEAAESLSLKCGESSIDLRKDGKLIVRGKDVLTRAKRTNRIKGGSVGIN